MKLLEKILLATDFGPSSDNIVVNAIGLAKVFKAKITLAHILPDNIKNDMPLKIDSILCPIDFSHESKRALKNAIVIARRFKAELTIFNVYEEAIKEFKICLNINDMHIPSLNGVARVYEKLGNKADAEKYNNMAKEVLSRIWDRKIEAEVRKYYRV